MGAAAITDSSCARRAIGHPRALGIATDEGLRELTDVHAGRELVLRKRSKLSV